MSIVDFENLSRAKMKKLNRSLQKQNLSNEHKHNFENGEKLNQRSQIKLIYYSIKYINW